MTPDRLLLSWVPPLVVGLTLAAAAEISAALLLYSGPGLLRALTMILAVEAGSAALGLWVAAGVTEPRVIEAIRRRWLFTLVVFSAAAVTAGVWAVVGGFADFRLGQGLGLAVLGGLPVYGAGALAGLLGRPQAGLVPSFDTRWPRPEVLVVLGAGLGFLLTGTLILRGVAPTSILLGCIVLLSGGALVHARLLRPGPSVRTVEERSTAVGIVRVEDRVSRSNGGGVRLLRVNGRIRGGEDRNGDPALPDEAEVLRTVKEAVWEPGPILVLGAGAGTLVRKLALLSPGIRVDAVEESAEILSLVRMHFPRLPDEARERVRFVEGDLRDPPGLDPGGYRLVLVDAVALAPGRPAPLLAPAEARRFRELLAADGTLVIHRLPGLDGSAASLEALLATVREALPDAELRPGPEGGGAADLRALGVDEPAGSLLVATRGQRAEAEARTEKPEEETDEHG